MFLVSINNHFTYFLNIKSHYRYYGLCQLPMNPRINPRADVVKCIWRVIPPFSLPSCHLQWSLWAIKRCHWDPSWHEVPLEIPSGNNWDQRGARLKWHREDVSFLKVSKSLEKVKDKAEWRRHSGWCYFWTAVPVLYPERKWRISTNAEWHHFTRSVTLKCSRMWPQLRDHICLSPALIHSVNSLSHRGNLWEKCKEIAILRDRGSAMGGGGNLSGHRTKHISTIVVSAS